MANQNFNGMLDAQEENYESDDDSDDSVSVSSESASESNSETTSDVDELDAGVEGPVEDPPLSMFDGCS